jgi:FkbM family methyltransferase
VTLERIQNRLAPLQQKVFGRLPVCPWRTAIEGLNPRTLQAHPPQQNIKVLAEDGDFKKLRFNSKHEAWFPKNAKLTADLWSEYLAVFWDHPVNGHYYVADTPVRSGDVCIDGGASEGFFGLQALEAGAARVICIEPSQVMARSLERTFENEIRDGRVSVKSAALAALNGHASFQFDPERPFAGALGGNDSEQVTAITLDRLAEEMNLGQVDFIKMDLEGAELQAIEGGLGLLRRDHPRLAITTYHREFDFTALRTVLRCVGYRKIKPAGITIIGSPYAPPFRPVMLHAWV